MDLKKESKCINATFVENNFEEGFDSITSFMAGIFTE